MKGLHTKFEAACVFFIEAFASQDVVDDHTACCVRKELILVLRDSKSEKHQNYNNTSTSVYNDIILTGLVWNFGEESFVFFIWGICG